MFNSKGKIPFIEMNINALYHLNNLQASTAVFHLEYILLEISKDWLGEKTLSSFRSDMIVSKVGQIPA